MVQSENKIHGACKEYEQDLVLYHYGECAENNRTRVQGHIEGCPSCRHFLDDLSILLPLTEKTDEPDEAFWESYSREIHRKLAALKEKPSWWKKLLTFLQPWPVPALATALILALALTLTFRQGIWRPQAPPPEQLTFLEILPVAENLEFFKAMEFLDAMDLLEAVGATKNGAA